jgi:hypothetical protein
MTRTHTSTRIPEAVADAVAATVIDWYWDHSDKLTKDQITTVLEADEGLNDVADTIWEHVQDYTWETENEAIKAVLEEHDIEASVADFRDQYPDTYPTIDIDIGPLVSRTHAYIGLGLELYHDQGDNAADYEDELALFRVDPATLPTWANPDELPARRRRRGKERLDPRDLADVWREAYYGGQWVALLAYSDFDRVAANLDRIRAEGLTLQAGTFLTVHSWYQGSTSVLVQLKRAMYLAPDMIQNIFHDSASSYGVQAVCGLVSEVWEGKWKVGKE